MIATACLLVNSRFSVLRSSLDWCSRRVRVHGISIPALCWFLLFTASQIIAADPKDPPRAHDPRLEVQLFAASPDIVHPVNLDFDSKGRLLVIESHTHFRPPNYDGPKFDRIRMIEDTDGDGKADKFTTFFEGTTFTMDIAAHFDGSIYIATRNEILRLVDKDGDGKADEQKRVVFLETKGNYPHNGLSGLAFDFAGNLYFGMGENIGASYRLIGSDGSEFKEEGEGGNIFWCTADGKKLRRVATGFWNPFGVCRDIFGRVFAVDNDPDAMPPCRMLHVVEGGDYGYQYRYGRTGRHPFQAWNGQLPGTLPMVTGVGEGPCEILSYESDGLPQEYLGNLLVTSWADHRVERYPLKERGASYQAERQPFVQGGKDFRPVGLAVAPDGSLFVSDWVLVDYQLHKRGAIWHIKPKDEIKPDRPMDPRKALLTRHRPLREAAARTLIKEEKGKKLLHKQLVHKDVRVRATCVNCLNDRLDLPELSALAAKEPVTALRAMEVRGIIQRGGDGRSFFDPKQPAAVRFEAGGALNQEEDHRDIFKLFKDEDPFLRHAAIFMQGTRNFAVDLPSVKDVKERIGILLDQRARGNSEIVGEFLKDPQEDVRFLAVKWIADQKLTKYRPQIVEALKNPQLSPRMLFAYSTALARIDNQDVNETRMADYFVTRLEEEGGAPVLRARLLQLVPATHAKLSVDLLARLLKDKDEQVQREVVRVLCEHPAPGRFKILLETARNADCKDLVRAQALAGLGERSQEMVDDLIALAEKDDVLRGEVLRNLVCVVLTPGQRERVEAWKKNPSTTALVDRVLGQKFWQDRPAAEDGAAWLKWLEGPADAEAGRRIFFHAKLGGCFRCHRVDGRGQDVGPDLSSIGQAERRNILESILQPSNSIAPHYQVWQMETADGKLHTGMLTRTYLDEYTYLDPKGALFKLKTTDIVENKAVPTSIMPNGLVDMMTDQELRDLLAYLGGRK